MPLPPVTTVHKHALSPLCLTYVPSLSALNWSIEYIFFLEEWVLFCHKWKRYLLQYLMSTSPPLSQPPRGLANPAPETSPCTPGLPACFSSGSVFSKSSLLSCIMPFIASQSTFHHLEVYENILSAIVPLPMLLLLRVYHVSCPFMFHLNISKN